jgi:hypothetical protein
VEDSSGGHRWILIRSARCLFHSAVYLFAL